MNLGAQVSVPQLVERARAEKADAVLVSQVVTQRDAHLLNTREMSAAFREAYPADRRPLLVVGGPRFDETMADELGVDRVFTRGTTPGEVASFIVHRLAPRAGCGMSAPEVGITVVHRRYVPFSDAHYAGNLVDGAYSMKLFGDVATEMCIRTDGDEGLFASYSDVQFLAPVRAGDVLEITCTLTRVGTRSRTLDLAVHVVARGEPTPQQPGGRGNARRAAARHHGDRHRRRPAVRLADPPPDWSGPLVGPRARHADCVPNICELRVNGGVAPDLRLLVSAQVSGVLTEARRGSWVTPVRSCRSRQGAPVSGGRVRG